MSFLGSNKRTVSSNSEGEDHPKLGHKTPDLYSAANYKWLYCAFTVRREENDSDDEKAG